jgi:AcrR family transcriptional regulator
MTIKLKQSERIYMDNKKRKILEKSKELFFIYGVKKTTVDEIAKASGIGKGTIYLYFSSKNDIVAELADLEANNIATQLKNKILPEYSSEKKLRVYIKSFIMKSYDFVNSNVHASELFVIMRQLRDTCKIDEKNYNTAMPAAIQILSEILLEGKKKGSFCFDNIFELIENMSFALQSYFPPFSTELSREDLDKKSDYIIGLIINNLIK